MIVRLGLRVILFALLVGFISILFLEVEQMNCPRTGNRSAALIAEKLSEIGYA